MANSDYKAAMKAMREAETIARDGYPLHQSGRVAEIIEKNQKICVELLEKQHELLTKLEADLRRTSELKKRYMKLRIKDTEDQIRLKELQIGKIKKNLVRLHEMRIKEIKEEISFYERKLEKLREGTEPSTSTNGLENAETD